MPRLFTGLEIPAEIGQTLSSLRGGLPGARWIDPENYHVTLRFIGDIDGISANEIASMLFRVNRKPFEVAVQGLSSFGGKKPRAVVANIAPSRPLIELQAELERLMSQPRAAAPTSVAMMTEQNSPKSWVKLTMIARVMPAETMAPISACAPKYGHCGTSRRRPFTPNMMPAIIGPSRRPAGNPAAPQISEMRTDRVNSASH